MATARHLKPAPHVRQRLGRTVPAHAAASVLQVPLPQRGSARSAVVLGVVAAGIAGAVPVGLGVGTGDAAPAPTLPQVQQQLNSLNAKLDVVAESYDQSQLALSAATQKSAAAFARVTAAQAELDSVKGAMGELASAAYRSGGTDQFAQLVDTNPQTFLDRAASLDRLAAQQNVQLAQAEAARVRVATATQAATEAVSAQRAIARKLAAQKIELQRETATQTSLMKTLQARAAKDALTSYGSFAPASRSARQETYPPPAVSGAAAVAVQTALAQLGKPYRYGASGPGSFDCSGLTSWAWAAAGVSLSHSSAAQFGEGQRVADADLQPGDLVFFGSPIHHVGLYVGNGNMVDAPHTGTVVKIQPVFRSDYVGAVRP